MGNTIMVTGAAGFIGSVMVGFLNRAGYSDLLLVDDFSTPERLINLKNKHYRALVDREQLFDWLSVNKPQISVVYHLGARTDTTEFDTRIFDKLNFGYSKNIWEYCSLNDIPLVYASSAATYGDGAFGYSDNHEVVNDLIPLNPYGESKNNFDKWALAQTVCPPHWYGLKFFNVFGPNEYHKNRMASVIFHAYKQIKKSGSMTLFRSHKNGFGDGEQKRDFIYVMDIVKICHFLAESKADSGLYNAGTGQARTFLDLAKAVFSACEKIEQITFIDTPADIRDKYQYFTEADMHKLKMAGYAAPFYNLEQAVSEYVNGFIIPENYY